MEYNSCFFPKTWFKYLNNPYTQCAWNSIVSSNTLILVYNQWCKIGTHIMLTLFKFILNNISNKTQKNPKFDSVKLTLMNLDYVVVNNKKYIMYFGRFWHDKNTCLKPFLCSRFFNLINTLYHHIYKKLKDVLGISCKYM